MTLVGYGWPAAYPARAPHLHPRALETILPVSRAP